MCCLTGFDFLLATWRPNWRPWVSRRPGSVGGRGRGQPGVRPPVHTHPSVRPHPPVRPTRPSVRTRPHPSVHPSVLSAPVRTSTSRPLRPHPSATTSWYEGTSLAQTSHLGYDDVQAKVPPSSSYCHPTQQLGLGDECSSSSVPNLEDASLLCIQSTKGLSHC